MKKKRISKKHKKVAGPSGAGKRYANVLRNTQETHISVKFKLDGQGSASISTGIPFLDHMLTAFTKHGCFDLDLKAKGDLHVDIHHTNEDVGITLGQAVAKALGDKRGIRRFGFFFVPLGDALTRVVLDISGRPQFILRKPEAELRCTTHYDLPEAAHLLESFVQHSGIDLHIEVLSGTDSHHVVETMFKGVGRALDMATQIDRRVGGIPSTKGLL